MDPGSGASPKYDDYPCLLRVNDVARMYGISRRTVRAWAVLGLLHGKKNGPRLWFFREDIVRAFFEQQSGC
jgi:hypothetical protein